MLKVFLNNLFQTKSILSLAFASIILVLFNYLGFIVLSGGYFIVVALSNLFIIWTLFECLFKREISYLVFLYFLAIPLENWMIRMDRSLEIIIFPFFINYSFIFISFLFYRILKRRKISISIEHILLFFIVLFFSILSTLSSKNYLITINGIVYGLILPFIIYIIVLNIVKRKEDIINILECIVFSLFFYNIFNVLVEFAGIVTGAFGNQRISGIFGNANFYSPILIVSTLVSLFLILYYRKTYRLYKPIFIATFVLSVFLLLSIGSRGSFIFFVLGSLLVIAQYITSINKKIFIFLFMLIVISTLYLTIDFSTFLQESNFATFKRLYYFQDSSFEEPRLMIWKNAIDFIVTENTLFRGTGFGILMYEEIGRSTPHSSPLHLAISIGIFGSLAYHILIVYSIYTGRHLKNIITINIVSIVIIALMLNMVFSGYRILLYIPDGNITIPSMNAHLDVILLWVFIGIANASNKINQNLKTND